jgi:very-short-patch-repair endonuclease
MKRKARVLRKNQTDAESLLWHHLRDRRLAGHKFRRQHPIGAFIADFVCVEHRIVVELDGGQHSLRVEDDNRRSAFLKSKGYEVVRFWNHEVLKDTQAVLEFILRIIEESDTPSPRPSPPQARERKANRIRCVKFG